MISCKTAMTKILDRNSEKIFLDPVFLVQFEINLHL